MLSATPSTKKILLNHASLFPDSLLTTRDLEFLWAAISSLPEAAGALVNQGIVAAFAGSITVVRNDENMMRLAEGAYCKTVRSMRQYTDDTHIRNLAVPLIIMTSSMISYKVRCSQ